MKLFRAASVLVASTLLPETVSQLQLPANFTLPSPNCTVSDENPGTVSCAYTGIEADNGVLSVQVLDYDYCANTYNGPPGIFQGTQTIDGIFYATAVVDYMSGYDGTVEFCVRTDLSNDSGTEIMRFRSEKVKMTFTYDGTFSVADFTTENYDGIGANDTTASKEFGAHAYLCDAQGNEDNSFGKLSIGTNLFVCIETNDGQTKIAEMTEFSATTENGAEFLAIYDTSSNVVITGVNTGKVIAVINFPVRFFSDNSVIVISGSVKVEQDNMQGASRKMTRFQENDQENESGEAEFALLIDVVTDESFATRHDIIAAIFSGLVSLLLV